MSEQHICHHLTRFILALPAGPGVDLHGGVDVGMADPLLHIFDVYPLADQNTDTGYSQVMQVKPLIQAAAFNDLLELLG